MVKKSIVYTATGDKGTTSLACRKTTCALKRMAQSMS